MSTLLPLDKMTIEQKMQALEELTIDLHKNEALIPTPEWHLEILREREQLVKDGKAHYVDWEVAKKQIDEAIARGRPHEGRDP